MRKVTFYGYVGTDGWPNPNILGSIRATRKTIQRFYPGYVRWPTELHNLILQWIDTPGNEDGTLSGVIADWIDDNWYTIKKLNWAPAKYRENKLQQFYILRDNMRHWFNCGGYAKRNKQKYKYDRKPAEAIKIETPPPLGPDTILGPPINYVSQYTQPPGEPQ